jgi:hypothetical protein
VQQRDCTVEFGLHRIARGCEVDGAEPIGRGIMGSGRSGG